MEKHNFLVHSHKILLLNEFIEKKQIEFIKFDILNDNINELFRQVYDKYKYINGAELVIDGGYSIRRVNTALFLF